MKSCPSDFWALSPAAYLPGANADEFFRQEYCVPSFPLKGTKLVSLGLSDEISSHLYMSVNSLVSPQKAMDIINRELCPYFNMPTSSGE